MFKKVEYVGFDGKPDLRAKAEQLTPVLAGEIGERQGEVEVTWSPHANSNAGVLDLTLSRTLINGVSGTHTGTFVAADFARDRGAARRGRRVWSDLLGVLLDKQHQRIQETFLEPAEA